MIQDIPSLCEVYKDYFPVGAAINPNTIKSHWEILKYHFNSITFENEMKSIHLQPSEDVYTFDTTDSIIHFAREYGMKFRGHVLVWHKQTPEWMFRDNDNCFVSKELLLQRMESHIRTVMTHYKDDVYCWDVVNEAIDEGDNYLRTTHWLDIIGEEYIEKAFIFAHQADPGALLFYNDYDAVLPEKREHIIKLISSLQKKDIPIHGIGLQGHWNIYAPSIDLIKSALDAYAECGLQIQITELDISLYASNDSSSHAEPTPREFDMQAAYYDSIFSLFRQYSDCITGVTLWGIADDCTWLDYFPVKNRKDWPLLFDIHHQPKKCFYNIIDF